MYQKIINFIKYHNAFSIGFMIVFVGFSAAFAASPDLRDVLVSSQDSVRSIDNSYISTADLDNLNFNLQITDITEDGENYYIVYNYRTIAIQDYVWQEVQKEKSLTVSKKALGDKDLGLYVAEQLGQNIDNELSYLKEVQTIEKEKGLTPKIVATQYAGLIGKLLEPKEKVFEDYQPVVQEPEPAPAIVEETASTLVQQEIEPPIAIPSIDRESLRQMIQELLGSQPVASSESLDQTAIFYYDGDGDGYGNWANFVTDPSQEGYVANSDDCNDDDPAINPGAAEICGDGIDNNCNGLIDTADPDCSTTTDATTTDATTTDATSTEPVCVSNWQCSDWQPLPETVACGATSTQTRICTDSNNCGTNDGKPSESQDAAGNLCSAQNAAGACQTGTCNFTCAADYSDCDNDMSNGCETASSTCPTP